MLEWVEKACLFSGTVRQPANQFRKGTTYVFIENTCMLWNISAMHRAMHIPGGFNNT